MTTRAMDRACCRRTALARRAGTALALLLGMVQQAALAQPATDAAAAPVAPVIQEPVVPVWRLPDPSAQGLPTLEDLIPKPFPGPEKAVSTLLTRTLDALPFIPIPEISTAPHAGVNVGLFGIVMGGNAQGQIDQILAPDVLHSQYFGWGARFRIFRNPSDDEKWSLVAGGKQEVEREFDAEWDYGLRRDRSWSYIAHAMYDRNGTGRFYGLGNDSTLAGESTFINSQMRVEFTAARNFSHTLQLGWTLRANTAEIEQSALDSLPALTARYPSLNGVGDASEVHQRLTWTLDTRDSIVVPRVGSRVAAVVGVTSRALGSSVDYSVLALDASTFRPVGKLTLAAHAAARYMPSFTNAPFWALSSLGGDRSVIGDGQPLRGFGAGRFIDRNSVSGSLELRMVLQRLQMFGTTLALEAAPFVDTGRVFASMNDNPLIHLHTAGGVGFRVITGPFVVGYLDLGAANEHLAIFTGIDYPF
jgi:hypothetical protein